MQRNFIAEQTKIFEHIPPLERAAGTVNSTAAVNALATSQEYFEDSMLVIHVGADSGNPDSFSLVVKLQEGATSTPATDVSGKTLTITAAGVYTIAFTPNQLLQYRDVNAVLTFVNGSTPKLNYSVIEVAGGAKNIPQS